MRLRRRAVARLDFHFSLVSRSRSAQQAPEFATRDEPEKTMESGCGGGGKWKLTDNDAIDARAECVAKVRLTNWRR